MFIIALGFVISINADIFMYHLFPKGFTTGGPTMSVFDKELEYLVRKTDPYQYYLFSEVSKITDCKGIRKDFLDFH